MDTSDPLTFKAFIKRFKEEMGHDWGKIIYLRFMELYESTYKNQDLSEVASDIVEYFLENIYEMWQGLFVKPLKYAYVSYLLEKAQLNLDTTKEIILKCLLETKEKFSEIYSSLEEEALTVNDFEVQRELIYFRRDFGKYIKDYSKQLGIFSFRYRSSEKRVALFFIIQFIFAIEKIKIPRILIKSIESLSASNYFLSPSPIHYRINPKETIFVLLRNNLEFRSDGESTWEKIQEELKIISPNTDEIYLFSLDTEISSDFFKECENSRVRLVTTKQIKDKHYSDYLGQVITLEDLLKKCQEKYIYWQRHRFSITQKTQLKDFYKKKLRNFVEFELLRDLYELEMKELEKDIRAHKRSSAKNLH